MPEEHDLPDETASDTQPQPTAAIDPVIAETPAEPTLDPVVRSTAPEESESGGFMRTLTSSIASSWNASREAQEQDEEWDTRPGPLEVGQRESRSGSLGAQGSSGTQGPPGGSSPDGAGETAGDSGRHEFPHPATGSIELPELGGYDPQTSTYTFREPQTPTSPGFGDRFGTTAEPYHSAPHRAGQYQTEWRQTEWHQTEWYQPDGTRVFSPAAGAIPIIDPHTGRPAGPEGGQSAAQQASVHGSGPATGGITLPTTVEPSPVDHSTVDHSPSQPGSAHPSPGQPKGAAPSYTRPATASTPVQAPGAGVSPATSSPAPQDLPPAGPTSPLTRPAPQGLRRRSVLRSSRRTADRELGRPGRESQRSARPLFDRSVFDQKVRPQSVLRRLMRPEAPMTSAIPIVDHLAGTPFENPRQAEAPVDTDELETIAFVLDVGEALFRYGAGALEVETSIIAITAAFGMKNTDVDITNQSISLNWAPEGKIPYSRVRVVRSWSSNFQALAGVHHLVTDIISGRLTRTEAAEQLEEITHEPKPFPRWMVTLSGAVFASAFASFLGAPLLDATIGFFATLLVLATTRRLTSLRVPEFYCLSAGGFVATFMAMGAVALEIPVEPFHVVAGGLMIMLPSVRVVSAIQDAINGFPLTSAGRIVSSLIAFIGLTSGIMVAVITANLLGTPEIEPARELERLYPFPVLVALVFVAAVAAAIVEQARWRILLPIGAVSVLGFCGYYAAELVGLGERITPVIGGIVVGALGRLVALRMNAPQLVVAVPAMMFMLPGLMVFRGMYSVAMRTETDVLAGLPVGMRESAEVLSQVPIGMLTGLTDLFNAMIIILGIAGGIVLGDVMMRPFTSAIQSHERRRFRHR